MRRGLLAWDEDEVPASALDARVERCRDGMRAAGLDALLVYNSFPRPAAVSWLTQFVPYWSQGVLILPKEGRPEYFVSLSKRVAGWVEETSHMGQVVSTPRLGADLAKRLDGATRIGVLELDRLPGGIGGPLLAGLPDATLEDATALYRAARHPADEAEIGVSRKAAAMAKDALDAARTARPHKRTGALTAAIEGPARLAGAEEVIVELAPDLDDVAALRRIDGDVPLGPRYALRLSLAYKGHWVRLGHTHGNDVDGAAGWHTDRLAAACAGGAPDGITVQSVQYEACIGSFPLSAVDTLPDGAIGTVNLTLSHKGRPHLASVPALAQDGTISALI